MAFVVWSRQEELQRITGQEDRRHLRICAARYESYAWRKSDNQVRLLEMREGAAWR